MHGFPEVKGRTLIFPMEIVERELFGNLLLGIEAIRRGWQVVIGTKRSVFDASKHLPKGLVFLKSIMACELQNMRNLKSAGHRLACLDVEGLVYTSPEEFVTVRFSPETLDEIDLGLFWGRVQRDAVAQAYPAHAQKFFTTGTPIVDLWRPALHPFYSEKVAELKKRYGKFILIPSSFASVNHFMGEDANAGIIERDELIAEDKQDEFFRFWRDYERYVKGNFEKFIEMIPALSKAFPEHKIIIRPHPSESHARWKEAAKGLDNVIVIFEGAVSPWLLAADAILHWGCTTGVEGYLMGRPVVAYNPSSPEDEAKYDHKIPHAISIVARTPEETFNVLRQVIENPDNIMRDYPAVAEGEKLLREWILYSDEVPAAIQVIEQLDRLGIERAAKADTVPQQQRPIKDYIWDVLGWLAKIPFAASLLPERIKLGVESRAYGRHKTRNIDAESLRADVQRLAKLRGTENIEVKQLGDNLFALSRGDAA